MAEGIEEKAASLAEAARAAEEELERFEGLVAAVRKIELNSEKAILRAGKTLGEAVAVQARIAEVLAPLANAFSRAQKRELAAAEQLQACAEQIHERTELFASLMERVRAVGSDALEVASLLRADMGPDGDAGDSKTGFEERLAEARERIESTVERAKEVRQLALAAGLTDVARQAEALQQQLSSARAKLKQGGQTDLN